MCAYINVGFLFAMQIFSVIDPNESRDIEYVTSVSLFSVIFDHNLFQIAEMTRKLKRKTSYPFVPSVPKMGRSENVNFKKKCDCKN